MATATDELPPEQELSEPLMDLTNLGRTVDGSSFAYRSLVCVNKRINPIKVIESYAHLQKIDLSQNAIKDVSPLKNLQNVLSLNLSSNEITTIKFWEEGAMPQLMHLDLSNNSITAFLALPFPALRTASFARNDIASCAEFPGHEKLTSLDLSENRLTSAAGIANMPALTTLNLAGGIRKENPSNQLESIEGLSGLDALESLNIARNKFSNLAGAWGDVFGKLTSLDISENALEHVRDKENPLAHQLNVLRQLPKLRHLVVKAPSEFCDCSDLKAKPHHGAPESLYARAEILVCHWRLESIDNEPVTADERETARLLNLQLLTAERVRKKAEEEAAKAEEEAA